MSRYYGTVIIEFLDGEVREVGGNRTKIDGCGELTVYEENDYGLISRMTRYPMNSIKSWKWKDGGE
jgi:hypothetical protein